MPKENVNGRLSLPANADKLTHTSLKLFSNMFNNTNRLFLQMMHQNKMIMDLFANQISKNLPHEEDDDNDDGDEEEEQQQQPVVTQNKAQSAKLNPKNARFSLGARSSIVITPRINLTNEVIQNEEPGPLCKKRKKSNEECSSKTNLTTVIVSTNDETASNTKGVRKTRLAKNKAKEGLRRIIGTMKRKSAEEVEHESDDDEVKFIQFYLDFFLI